MTVSWNERWFTDPVLCGASIRPGLVAVEEAAEGSGVIGYWREQDSTRGEHVPFRPFLVTASALEIDDLPAVERVSLDGDGPLDTVLRFADRRGFEAARRTLAARIRGSGQESLLIAPPDLAQQYLITSGDTLFKGMAFMDLRRLQVDIECVTTPGYDFCNAEREGDRIVAVALADGQGWTEVIGGASLDERSVLEQFVRRVRERDPDVIEGHNLFAFDLPYLMTRAERHGVTLSLGRDGSPPSRRPSRFNAGDRAVSYMRVDIHGRHILDTLFLAQSYDVSHRALDSLGLKAVAVHFGVAAPDRTYVAGHEISAVFEQDPDRLMAYVRDDAIETGAIASVLAPSVFAQTRMLPFSYQDAALRGNAVKIDALMLREYLRLGQSLPAPSPGRPFAGGYTDLFQQGVIRNVHHGDIRSLYPSLMRLHRLGPATDRAGVFLNLLETLLEFRLETKSAMRLETDAARRREFDALQASSKVLVNSFYGYLGFAQARFNDFDAADRITREGRELLTRMVLWLEAHGARPVEIDTDGIYYVPPPPDDEASRTAFRQAMADSLPEGIEIEFDGEYVAMYSYRMKNYALLDADGRMTIKGAALKSRGLERYQRDFVRRMLRLRLEGRESELPALKAAFDEALARHEWPLDHLAKTEVLADSPAVYQRKREREGAPRRAAYELALAAGREYRAGDQVAYYVTGAGRQVTVHEHARLLADADPGDRDENLAYYQAKLDALYEKLGGPVVHDPRQGELF